MSVFNNYVPYHIILYLFVGFLDLYLYFGIRISMCEILKPKWLTKIIFILYGYTTS